MMMMQHRMAAVPAPSTAADEAGPGKDGEEDRKPEGRTTPEPPSSHVVVLPTATTTVGGLAAAGIRKAAKLAAPTYSRRLLFLVVLLVALSLLATTSNLLKYAPIHATFRYLTATSQRPPRHERQPLQGGWVSLPSTSSTTVDHAMTDEQLFWRASLVPRINRYPFDRVPKVAFMFLARGHLPLYPLWERFLAGNDGKYSLYVHSSLPGYRPQYPAGSPFHGRQIPSKVAEWGEMSMQDAERRLLANALLDVSNERFILLSESCIPLRNFTTVYAYLTGSLHSFVGVFDDPGPFGRGRYDPRMAPLVPFELWRKGSQWFEVDRDAAVAIVSDFRYYPLFRDFCRPPCYADEHYMPTMLTIERPGRTANRSVTLVDWSRGGAHPATFGAGDVQREGFLKRIVEAGRPCQYNGKQEDAVCHLFARKFAPSALQPLLDLAPTVLGF